MADAALSASAGAHEEGRSSTSDAFGARFHGPLRAPERARRAGRPPARHRGHEDPRRWSPAAAPSRGARRAPAAPAPARAARRCGPAAASSFGPQPRSYTFKVNRKEQRAALRSALSLHAGRGSLAIARRRRLRRSPRPAGRCDLLDDWSQPAPDARRRSPPRSRRGAVVPQPRARRGADARERRRRRPPRRRLAGALAGRARRAHRARRRRHRIERPRCSRLRRPPRKGASSKAPAKGAGSKRRARRAREHGRSRAPKDDSAEEARTDGALPGHHPPGRLREELRALRGRQVHLPRPPRRPQDADPPGGRGAVRRARGRGAHA